MAACPSCGAENTASAMLCVSCGERLLKGTGRANEPPLPVTASEPACIVAGLADDNFPTHDSSDAKERLSQLPGQPEQTMNDAIGHHSSPTIPATDPADGVEAVCPLPPDPPLRPKLVVLRGLRINAEYPIYEGRNTIGRFADKPVDIDLVSQESIEQIWCSRQHAVLTFDCNVVAVEDLNSLNGTWVNGTRVPAGQRRALKAGDVIQVGTVQMKLVIS